MKVSFQRDFDVWNCRLWKGITTCISPLKLQSDLEPIYKRFTNPWNVCLSRWTEHLFSLCPMVTFIIARHSYLLVPISMFPVCYCWTYNLRRNWQVPTIIWSPHDCDRNSHYSEFVLLIWYEGVVFGVIWFFMWFGVVILLCIVFGFHWKEKQDISHHLLIDHGFLSSANAVTENNFWC